MKTRPTTTVLFALTLLPTLMLGGCADPPTAGYPADYRGALRTQHGIDPVPADYVDTFVDLFRGPVGPETVLKAQGLYADDVYFSDTLTTTRDRDSVIAHFERLAASGTRIELEVHDRLHQGQDVYVIWSMAADFQAGHRDIASDTIGISQLRYNAAGQIILHQDFWDAAHGFYRHLPVLGSAVQRISEEFTAP